MIGSSARKRLDDITDPVWKLSQYLVRFVSRRHTVHARPVALVAQTMATIIGVILKLSI